MIVLQADTTGPVILAGDPDIAYDSLGDAIRALHDPEYKDGDDDQLDLFNCRNQPTNSTVKVENIPVTAKSKLPSQWATLNWIDYIRDNVFLATAPFHPFIDLITDMSPTHTNLEPDMSILTGYHKLMGIEFDETNATQIIKLKKFVGKLPTAMKLIGMFKYHPHTIINLIYRMYECKSISAKCIPMYPMNKIDGKYTIKFTPEYSEQVTAHIDEFYETEISYTVKDTTIGDLEYGHIWNDDSIQASIDQAIHRAELSRSGNASLMISTDYRNIPIIIGQDIKGRKSYLVNTIDATTTEYIIPMLVGIKWAKGSSSHPLENCGSTYDPVGGNS